MAEVVVHGIESFGGVGKIKIRLTVDIGDHDLASVDFKKSTEFASHKMDEFHRLLIRDILYKNGEDERKTNKKEILGCFGSEVIYTEEIPSGYSQDNVNTPWFIVTTKAGRIKLGWRKRVINIDYVDCPGVKVATELFPNETSTRGSRNDRDDSKGKFIHAWTLEKAAEYIKTIINSDKYKTGRCWNCWKELETTQITNFWVCSCKSLNEWYNDQWIKVRSGCECVEDTFHWAVCVPSIWTPGDVEAYANASHPHGVPWKVVDGVSPCKKDTKRVYVKVKRT